MQEVQQRPVYGLALAASGDFRGAEKSGVYEGRGSAGDAATAARNDGLARIDRTNGCRGDSVVMDILRRGGRGSGFRTGRLRRPSPSRARKHRLAHRRGGPPGVRIGPATRLTGLLSRRRGHTIMPETATSGNVQQLTPGAMASRGRNTLGSRHVGLSRALGERVRHGVGNVPIDAQTLRSAGLLLWYWGFRPSSEPAAHLIEAAMKDVPDCLRKMAIKDPQDKVNKTEASALIEALAEAHPGPSPAFAVFRLIEKGLLGAEIRDYEIPVGKYDASDWMGGPRDCEEFYVVIEDGSHSQMFHSLNGIRRDHRLVVWADPQLWDWWRLLPETAPAVPARIKNPESRRKTPSRKRKKSDIPTTRQMEAYGFHSRGLTHLEVGEQMGISRQAAGKLIRKAAEILDRKRRSPRAKRALPTDRRGQVVIKSTAPGEDEDELDIG